jgi:hypothetical protein
VVHFAPPCEQTIHCKIIDPCTAHRDGWAQIGDNSNDQVLIVNSGDQGAGSSLEIDIRGLGLSANTPITITVDEIGGVERRIAETQDPIPLPADCTAQDGRKTTTFLAVNDAIVPGTLDGVNVQISVSGTVEVNGEMIPFTITQNASLEEE